MCVRYFILAKIHFKNLRKSSILYDIEKEAALDEDTSENWLLF